jgi:hypothetical protein
MALRFVTTESKTRWDKVALDLVLGNLLGGGVVSSYASNPKVVAVNDAGQAKVIETVDTALSVDDRLDDIQRDYDLLSIEEWCEKYDVPVPFAEG